MAINKKRGVAIIVWTILITPFCVHADEDGPSILDAFQNNVLYARDQIELGCNQLPFINPDYDAANPTSPKTLTVQDGGLSSCHVLEIKPMTTMNGWEYIGATYDLFRRENGLPRLARNQAQAIFIRHEENPVSTSEAHSYADYHLLTALIFDNDLVPREKDVFAPEITLSPAGFVLELPRIAGAQGVNYSVYYHWHNNRWNLMHVPQDRWEEPITKAIDARMPKSYGKVVEGSISPDIKTLKAKVYLWKEGASFVDPETKQAVVQLDIVNDTFVFKNVTFETRSAKNDSSPVNQ